MLFDVAFLDIGHGDCSVVTFTEPDDTGSGGGRQRCIVIDGGEEGAKGVSHLQDDAPSAAYRLNAYLKLRGIRIIDLLIATHIDSDHIGGLVTFLKEYTRHNTSQSAPAERTWNVQNLCIGQYWGPAHDAYWGLIGRERGAAEQRRYQEAMRLLVKLKLKKKRQLTSEDQAEMERLEKEITELQRQVEHLLQTHDTRSYLIRSIEQNGSLTELVRSHTGNPERDVLSPDLSTPPPAPFKHVRVDFLWPDMQIPDTVTQASLLRPVNVTARRFRPWAQTTSGSGRRPAHVAELLERVLDNQEHLARQEDRKANNRSLVVSIRPTEWKGNPRKWPVVLFAGDAESESWQRMVSRYHSGELSAYILKMPHHGSSVDNGLSPEALAAIAPRFAIISVGQIYRLPSATALNLLRGDASGPLDIFCTERNRNPDLQAACYAVPDGCVRRTLDEHRGVVFSFDTERGTCAVVRLQLEKEGDTYRLKPSLVKAYENDPRSILWCRQPSWDVT